MRFCALEATFGRLEHCRLGFSPGLNIIQAPNESGKSTLAAFLRVMLYGLPTRERRATADKNRYAPWSGLPMQGTLELSDETFGDVTLRREASRAGGAMERFSATRTGTLDEAPGLGISDCGERLLGIPREVYERSAFIRQSGLTVDASAELEKRIAALVTTGEESVSYSEAVDVLKKQLNARRSRANAGRIPALERELEAGRASLAETEALLNEKRETEKALVSLREEEAVLRGELSLHERADRRERFYARERARQSADEAAREARVFRRMLEDAKLPSREILEQNRARLCEVEALERQRRAAENTRGGAELALSQFDARPGPALRPVSILYMVSFFLCVAAAAAVFVWKPSLPLFAPHVFAAAGLLFAVLFAVLFAAEAVRVRKKRGVRNRERAVLEKALYDTEDACRSLKEDYDRAFAAIYETVPVGDAVSAAAYIHENLARYDMLAQMEADAALLRRQADAMEPAELGESAAQPVERPAKSRESLEQALADVRQRLAEAQSRADYTAGCLRAQGDAGELRRLIEDKQAALAQAQEEYDALSLALETLERANAALQTRFSPELGRRAAEYFSILTGGRHDTVLLDRAFHAFSSEVGDGAVHEAALLSQGAYDQLYLAVRLAICDMVLPAERRVPYVLDDALVSFDDERCRAALELLCRIAQSRQVLLLTCQGREPAMLAGRENVTVTSL